MKTQYTICLFVVVALLSGCKTAQRTPPPTASPPSSSSPPSTPSQESSSRRSSPSQDSSNKPSSPSPSQSPSAKPSMPTQETAQSKPSASGQPSTSTPAGASDQQEAATELKQAGQQVADVGALLPQGASGSEQPPPSPVSKPGNEEWDPLMLPDEAAASASQSNAVAEAGGAESATAENAAAESAESAAADSGASGSAAADAESTDMAGASGDVGIEDPLADEIQAAREALQEAGIALETAGGALETATSSEELAAAEAALARARVSVIVAGQDLLDLQELVTDPSMGEIIDQAEEALNQANSAIVIASDSIFSTRISLPEFEQDHAAGGGGKGNRNESELDKELNDSIVVFETQILEARNDVIGSAPAPTSAENIPGVAVLGGTLEDDTKAGSLEENQETLILTRESEVTQQGRMPEGAELASVEDKTASLIPDDIPDPQGDDIVAQQLREAAVAETDPALREKLWEEYRRYKAGL